LGVQRLLHGDLRQFFHPASAGSGAQHRDDGYGLQDAIAGDVGCGGGRAILGGIILVSFYVKDKGKAGRTAARGDNY